MNILLTVVGILAVSVLSLSAYAAGVVVPDADLERIAGGDEQPLNFPTFYDSAELNAWVDQGDENRRPVNIPSTLREISRMSGTPSLMQQIPDATPGPGISDALNGARMGMPGTMGITTECRDALGTALGR